MVHGEKTTACRTLLYLSLGFASEHVVCVVEGSFKSHAGVTLQRLLFAQSNMEVSGSINGSIHSPVTVEHSVVGPLHSILDQDHSQAE